VPEYYDEVAPAARGAGPGGALQRRPTTPRRAQCSSGVRPARTRSGREAR
jgi:hypothetical protein